MQSVIGCADPGTRNKSKKLTAKDMDRQQKYIDALVRLGEIDKKG